MSVPPWPSSLLSFFGFFERASEGCHISAPQVFQRSCLPGHLRLSSVSALLLRVAPGSSAQSWASAPSEENLLAQQHHAETSPNTFPMGLHGQLAGCFSSQPGSSDPSRQVEKEARTRGKQSQSGEEQKTERCLGTQIPISRVSLGPELAMGGRGRLQNSRRHVVRG